MIEKKKKNYLKNITSKEERKGCNINKIDFFGW